MATQTPFGPMPVAKAEKKKAERPAPVTNVDRMDLEMFDILTPRHDVVTKMLKENDAQAFHDLLADGFGMFFKARPELLSDVPMSRVANAAVIEQMQTLPEYQNLRNYTKGDEVSALGALPCVKEIFKKLPEEVKQKQEELSDEASRVDDWLNGQGQGDLKKPGTKKVWQKKRLALSKKQKALQDALKRASGKIRKATREALAETTEKVDDQNALADALGWGFGAGTPQKVSLTDRMKLASQVEKHAELRKVAKLAGRLIAIALRKQTEKVDYARTEMAGIETGNYLPDVLPEEFIKLEDPELENQFYREFLESKLQQYELKSKESVGQGPIFCAIDCSGSMDTPVWIPKNLPEDDYEEYEKQYHALPTAECWAKANALALFAIARRQHRDYEAVLFDDGIHGHIKIGKDEQFKPEQLAMFFGIATYGGTNFEPPLRKFLDSLSERKNADCVFITDGQCELPEAFLKEFKATRERLGFHVISILVNAGSWGRDSLKKFSNSIHCIPDESEEKVLDDIYSV